MALATYSDLQNQIANWLERADLGAVIPDFVTLFEAYANRRLRVRQMETSATLTTVAGVATIPTDYLMWRSATWNGNANRELGYAEPSWFRAWFVATAEEDPNVIGTPTVFTIENTTFTEKPIDDTATVTFRYWQKIPALSGTVNWLYAAHPDVYLFGSLVEANAFTPDPDKAALWKSRRDEIMDEIEKLGAFSQGGNAGPIRPMGWIV